MKSSKKCSAVRPEPPSNIDYSFARIIPLSIQEPIKQAIALTSTTGREQSLTFCRLKNKTKIYVANHVIGDADRTSIKPCSLDSDQIGDLHTHPTSDNTTVGITPSTSDIVSTLTDSVDHKIPQVSCIAGPDAKYVSCYQPNKKVMDDKNKIEGYKKTLSHNDSKVTDVPSFIRDNVAHDFVHAWYAKNTFKRTVPNPEDVVHDAFTKSGQFLKFDDVPVPEKPKFCKMIQDLNYPTHDNRVSKACVKYLKV